MVICYWLGWFVLVAVVEAGRVAPAAVVAGQAVGGFELEFSLPGAGRRREPLPVCAGERFEDALPVRPFRFGKGLRSFAGWWYFATTGAHVGFESWLERDHLMLMDFDPAVRAVSSQPFWLRWRDGGAGPGGMRRISLPAEADGTAVVVDVRPDDRIPDRDAETFAVTALACEAGWVGVPAGRGS